MASSLTRLRRADLRIQARHWCLETAGQRVHGTTRRLPLLVFQEEEQAKLLPWDGEPYDVPDWREVTVHPDHHIAYRYALYSAPSGSCPSGTKLEVRGDTKLVRLYKRGVLVKVHPRQPAYGGTLYRSGRLPGGTDGLHPAFPQPLPAPECRTGRSGRGFR